MPRILVIDDEPAIRTFMRISLAANGHAVTEADGGQAGLAAALAQSPDLVILDLGLPDLDGQEVISRLRARSEVPILVLSVRSGEVDKVEALDRGANDYIVKPFGVAELMARVRAALRGRAGRETAEPVVEAGRLRIDLGRRVVARGEAEIRLSRREWDLLAELARHVDRVLTHRQILAAVWGPAHVEDTVYLRVYVNQLRQKLEEDPVHPRLIVTEPGVGYRLRRDETD
jgi:two-component system KDP operon response regulator KdpE